MSGTDDTPMNDHSDGGAPGATGSATGSTIGSEPSRTDASRDTSTSDGGGRRRIAPLIVGVIAVVMIGLFVVLAGADSGGSGESADTPLLGRPAPEATGTLDDGTAFDLSRRKGSWVVLNFFDPECIPCIQEHPELVQFSEDQESLGTDGAELYSVITRGDRDEIDEFFAENGGDWPQIYSEHDEFPVAFGVAAVPETWIIDPSGVVQLRLISKVTADDLNGILRQFREQYA